MDNNSLRIRQKLEGGRVFDSQVWTMSGPADLRQIGGFGPKSLDQCFIDTDPKKVHNRFNDCSNGKYETICNAGDSPIPIDALNIAINPNQLSEERVSNYPISALISDLVIDQSMYEVYLEADHPSEVVNIDDFAKSVLSDRRIPTDIHIDRDPFDRNFSIWYLLVDLYQVGGLWSQLFSGKAQRRRLSSFLQLDGKKTAKQLSNDYLAVQFGLLPTIDDIVTFVRILSSWRERYDEASDWLLEPKTWHCPVTKLPWLWDPGEQTFDGFSTVRFFDLDTNLIPIRAVVSRLVAECHRSVEYHFVAPEFRGWTSRLAQFVDAFGVLDPAALWDAIPFSFIVDWFYGIGNWLHKNRPQLFPADLKITNYCESIKFKTQIKFYASYTSWSGDIRENLVDQHICTKLRTSYVRRVCKPPADVGISAPKFNASFLSIRRAFISAALLGQRAFR